MAPSYDENNIILLTALCENIILMDSRTDDPGRVRETGCFGYRPRPAATLGPRRSILTNKTLDCTHSQSRNGLRTPNSNVLQIPTSPWWCNDQHISRPFLAKKFPISREDACSNQARAKEPEFFSPPIAIGWSGCGPGARGAEAYIQD